MKDSIILILKGFFFGIANIIPGVSGGTLAMTLGVYEELIETISHFFHDWKKSIKFLFPFFLGAGLSILLMSKVISYCLAHFPLPTTLFFVGLILGGIPLIAKKVQGKKANLSCKLLFLLTFGLIMVMTFLQPGNFEVSLENPSLIMYGLLFLVGVIAAATMVIPGVSGSFVLMILGFYQPIVGIISDLTHVSHLGSNLAILLPFGLGVVLGIVLVAKLIEWLFHKYEVPTYYAILGFVVASIVALFAGVTFHNISLLQVLLGMVCLIVAFVIGYKLGDE